MEFLMNIIDSKRRYDLDWLRIIAFGFLIFYHIGMFYVSWGWHVKSVHAGPWAEPGMRLLNPWRLSLLFLISGIAIRFAMDKTPSMSRFTWKRSWRLLIPLIFGMIFIVTPQSWLELITKGETDKSFWAFFPDYMNGGFSITTPTWNHLWYVAYIFVYTLILAPMARLLSRLMHTGNKVTAFLFDRKIGTLAIFLIPFIPHMVYRIYLDPHFPTTHDVVNDWANHAHSFTYFLMGFLIAKDFYFWQAVRKVFPFALVITTALAIILTIYWNDWDAHVEAGHNLWPARTGRVLYAWLCILTLLGFAQRYLNRPSRTLSYMTEAIFPWYILHQTLIVMAGYWLTRQGLSAPFEFISVILATIGGCLILHEFLIRRSNLLRPFFGLKLKAKPPNRRASAG